MTLKIQAEDVIGALFNPAEKVCLRVFADNCCLMRMAV